MTNEQDFDQKLCSDVSTWTVEDYQEAIKIYKSIIWLIVSSMPQHTIEIPWDNLERLAPDGKTFWTWESLNANSLMIKAMGWRE